MYRNRDTTDWIRFRIYFVVVLFAIGTVLLVIRAYRLHITDAEQLRKRAGKQRNRVIHLEARRGMIFDRTGEQLAASLEVNSICASPRRVRDKERTARALARILKLEEKDLLRKLSEDRAFVWIQRRVSPLPATKVKQANLRGIFSVMEFRRFYPLRSLGSHAIGFAGIDSRGLEGLELYYDKDLKSDPVPITAQKDALGRPVMFAAMAQGPRRRDLHLTLDKNIQYIVEKELDEAVRRERAKSGVAVVMNVDDGEVLALAVRPTYNLNVFHKVPADARRNRAVTDTFEPGSTFKVFLAAAVLDLGRARPGDKFYCHKGKYQYKGSEIHDIVPRNRLTFNDVIAYSSNIGAVKLSEKLKRSEFYRVLKGFGFGSPTRVDLPGERAGILAPPGKWSVLTKANVAFGQGITVNALQLTTAFAAAINGGTLYRPRLMKRMSNRFAETIRENGNAHARRVIKPSTSEQVRRMLRLAVRKGTGRAARIKGVDVIGKTGTAQKAAANGGYSRVKYVASFIGALMGVQPRLAIFVMLDEPGGKHKTGGKIAAPVFRKIAKAILALCGNGRGAPQILLASSKKDVSARPRPRRKRVRVRKGRRPGEWIVPDLRGLNMRQVIDVCGKIKCDASFKGAGVAVRQHPAPGKKFKEGATLEVSFEGQSS